MRSYYELTLTTQAHLFPLGVKHVVPLSPILELLQGLVVEEWVLGEKVDQVLLMGYTEGVGDMDPLPGGSTVLFIRISLFLSGFWGLSLCGLFPSSRFSCSEPFGLSSGLCSGLSGPNRDSL